MELTFLGKGSAFNTQLGNNSAYIKAGSSLFLLDCGGTTFSKLLEKDINGNFILQGIASLTIVITHLHPDHVGSLADLVFYCREVLSIKPMIVYPNSVDIVELLFKHGVNRFSFNVDALMERNTHGYRSNDLEIFLEPIEVEHARELFCYAYLISVNDKTIFYSGDALKIPSDIINLLETGVISEFYQDISGKPLDNRYYFPHMQYETALTVFKPEVRPNVYIMHQDEELVQMVNTAISDGFKVV